ncbi:response regulator [Cystobacter fuscus]|uniref:response regulator n=1 Tax=Cystobacter fuscus TaxID=43 RepID=UPI002B29351B|nr:response regulator [Cystobacter fuscus]
MEPKRAVTILMADDDPDDRDFARSAMQESRLANELRFVEDGEELINYLRRLGRYANPKDSPRPGLILLDLNMPRKDGREALREIKSDPALKNIPIVVLTTSKAEEDILRSYNLGANCFITKPVTFDGLVEVVKVLNRHWLQIVELPPETNPE